MHTDTTFVPRMCNLHVSSFSIKTQLYTNVYEYVDMSSIFFFDIRAKDILCSYVVER